jgi:hypothetical protein
VNFWRHFKDTWHEGVSLAAGYVIVRAWESVGLPSGTGMILEAGRVARFWLAMMTH